MSPAPKFILVTRPQPEADKLCVLLGNQGIQAVPAPMVTVEFPACPPIEYHNIQALLVTSKNGLRALMRSQYKNFFFQIPLFAVGESTARLAKTLGFLNIHQGNGRAEDLIPLIKQHTKPEKGTLFHLAGSVLAWDLKTPLEQEGFKVIAPVIYHARAEKSFPEKIKTQLAMRQIDRVILMSPRITKIFITVMEQESLTSLLQDLHFYCLSENVAQPLIEHSIDQPLKISIAQKPTQDMLLSLIIDSA